ncbi:hypothetical protein RHMOL_Rhmol07G0209900 [Rhododendron molle]|uniref:Uncharacterized protein n=1 Tax=Rhododendron molle TaxID=49168 RepID=A0ACC0N425_RHOML|nr:hypothetical protein RHMOL_Rhmol07G0209900 [Rhododendron molle]
MDLLTFGVPLSPLISVLQRRQELSITSVLTAAAGRSSLMKPMTYNEGTDLFFANG